METMKEYIWNVHTGEALSFYYCGWEKCAPGHAFGPAVRSHYLFHFVLKGRGVYERGGARYPVEEGKGFLILPGESTVYAADEKDPWEYCWIGFSGAGASRILRECGLWEQNLIYTDKAGLLREEMLHLVELNSRPDSNGYTLLGQLYRCLSRMVEKPSAREESGKAYTDTALAFIRNNFSYDIGVSDIARHVGVDRTYLFRVFKRHLGQSPQEYLTQFRLGAAAGLLKNSALTVTEVALSCGFKELSAFDKQFKKRYGATPLQYRNQLG